MKGKIVLGVLVAAVVGVVLWLWWRRRDSAVVLPAPSNQVPGVASIPIPALNGLGLTSVYPGVSVGQSLSSIFASSIKGISL